MKKEKIKTRSFTLRMKEPLFCELLKIQPHKKNKNGTIYSIGTMVQEAVEMYVQRNLK